MEAVKDLSLLIPNSLVIKQVQQTYLYLLVRNFVISTGNKICVL
jgi:hypothetical protein